MRLWISKRYASKTCLPLKRWQSNSMLIQIRIFPRVNQPLIHWKYLTRRSESMIDSLCPQKRNVAKIQPIVPEWISLDSFKNLDSKKWISSDSRCNQNSCCRTKKNRSFTGFSCAGLIKEQAQTAWLFSGEVRLNSFCQQKMLYKSSHCCKASAFFALYSRFYS